MADRYFNGDEEDKVANSKPAEWLTISNEQIAKKYKWLETMQSRNLAGANTPGKYQVCAEGYKGRTRFGITPFERNRVRLSVKEPLNDYFSGSNVSLPFEGTQDVLSCIATQHPQAPTISHFWQMVHDLNQHVVVIAMLLEGTWNEKYVPTMGNGPVVWKVRTGTGDNDTQLATLEAVEEKLLEQAKTRLTILNLEIAGRTTKVHHFRFLNWPDHGVPATEDIPALISMVYSMEAELEEKAFTSTPARVVHCLAGIGRTGTFIALEYLLRQLAMGMLFHTEHDYDPIFDVVMHLRDERPFLVEQPVQYEFLYKVMRICYAIATVPGEVTEEFPKLHRWNVVPKVSAKKLVDYIKVHLNEIEGTKKEEIESKEGAKIEDVIAESNGESSSSELSVPEAKKAKLSIEGDNLRAEHEAEHPVAEPGATAAENTVEETNGGNDVAEEAIDVVDEKADIVPVQPQTDGEIKDMEEEQVNREQADAGTIV